MTHGRREYARRKRALSNTSINSILALLSQILQRAEDYRYIERNPLKVGERRERFLPAAKPARTFLEVDELLSLLDAAGELDASAAATGVSAVAPRARRSLSRASGSPSCAIALRRRRPRAGALQDV